MDELGFLLLSGKKLGRSSIMPQKRNPGFLEGARSNLSSILGKCWSVYLDLHNTHLQDTKDVRGEAMVLVVQAAEELQGVIAVLAETIEGLIVDAERGVELSRRNFSTATELADALVRYGGIDFRSGHSISSAATDWLRENHKTPAEMDGSILEQLSERITGRKISLSPEQFQNALSPEHFIEIRDNLGGPAEGSVRAMIRSCAERLKQDETWIEGIESRFRSALEELDRAFPEL
jgi:argininosuccinate lyase